MGPSGLACDSKGTLYVSQYDFAAPGRAGLILALDPYGKVVHEIAAPAAELTGLALTLDGMALVATEASTNAVYRIRLDM
jgi:sugar lactone lactonase YvrE